MVPHYFGLHDAQLFGCYHAPTNGAARTPIVLCNPIGHEYMACYRTIRQAAVRLAQLGAPALRFDYYGAGDSAGESFAGGPVRWLADITTAVDSLRARHRHAPAALLGLRLGGTLGLIAAQTAAVEPRALVLWDPIVNGGAYAAELMALQEQRVGGSNEVLGFPFSPDLRRELERIDLLTIERAPRQVLLVETGDRKPEIQALQQRLQALGANVNHRLVAGAPIWHEPNKASVPAGAIQAVTAWAKDHL